MMTARAIKHVSRLVPLLAALAAFSCTKDKFGNGPASGEPGTLAVTVRSEELLPAEVATRVGDPKSDAEKEIKQFYLFFFDQQGKYLKANTDEERFFGFQTSQPGTSVMNIDSKAIDPEQLKGEITVYAVANVEEGTFRDSDKDGRCDGIDDLAALQGYEYSPEAVGVGLPESGMPMVGMGKITLSQDRANALTIEMKALMARVDVTLRIDSETTTEDRLPRLSMIEWGAVNLPESVCFTAPESGVTPADVSMHESVTVPRQDVIYNRNGTVEISFYVFENLQPADKADPDGEKEEKWNWTGDYPAGPLDENGQPTELSDAEKQRYKPCLSNGRATAVEIHCNYYTYNSTDGQPAYYDVTYTLYPGADPVDDFNVRRNSQYRSDVVIKGITQVGTNPDHVNFDARVNILENNNYFVSILRERNHDAHFCVTPMDIYLFKEKDDPDVEPTMEVTLGDDANDAEGNPWIRMERIPANLMESGNVTDDPNYNERHSDASSSGKWLDNRDKPWHAGTGKRRWFTTGLLKELDTNTVKERGTGGKTCVMHHRDRIYFYLDENLGDNDRTATVTLVYKENGAEISHRTLEIRQVPLLEVKVYNRENPRKHIHTIYMEQYEEYAQHYDPLDEYSTTAVYTGRTWGNDRLKFGDARIIPLHEENADNMERDIVYGRYFEIFFNYYHGRDLTPYLCKEAGQSVMNLNGQPRSAPEYCYNKNIRNSSGTVPFEDKTVGWPIEYVKITRNDAKWFLPGIRQMEDALSAYYTAYSEFASDFYWSSSVARNDGIGNTQNTSRARATKIEGNQYVESYDSDDAYPSGGWAKRTESLRVRAFRIDKKPIEY